MEPDTASSAATSSAPEQQQPLLRGTPPSAARPSLASLLSRAAGRRSGPSAVVRETTAMQLEERRADWAYSPLVVALDVSWNLACAIAAAVMLSATLNEEPNVPVRVWVAGYGVQCAVHAALVWAEYKRRRIHGGAGGDEERGAVDSDAIYSSEEDGDEGGSRPNRRWSFFKRCESVNTVASFLWWIIGFYWVISGGDLLLQDAPKLYWLTVEFLAFDVLFAIFCVALACTIGIALCCCLPCIIAILYAVAGQEGASDADINMLPRYRYAEPSDNGESMSAEGAIVPIMNSSWSSSEKRVLLQEDAECCICLTPYEDGTELRSLPCNHHFHSTCLVKWLRINATCPLCKYNIHKGIDCV